MERLPMETLESIIGIQKTTLEAFEKHGSEDSDYCPAYDKAVLMLLEELKQYRIAEKQGLLLRLPVPEGAVVYTLSYIYECKFDYDCKEFDAYKCEEDIPCKHQYKVYRVKETKFQKQMLAMFGKTVFLSKEEAEQALAKMKEV